MASGLGDLKEVDDLDKEFESLEADVDLDAELAKYKTNSDSSSEN